MGDGIITPTLGWDLLFQQPVERLLAPLPAWPCPAELGDFPSQAEEAVATRVCVEEQVHWRLCPAAPGFPLPFCTHLYGVVISIQIQIGAAELPSGCVFCLFVSVLFAVPISPPPMV